jgi:hypothetical protein
MSVVYSINKSSELEIKKHLISVSKNFVPELDSYVNIEEYSKKLFEKSTRIEAYSGENLIGLIAIYLNNSDSFITNYSV